jgi:hypothetical protein
MGFESMPSSEKPGSERIKIVGKDGVERSLTPEEYEEHVKAEARKKKFEEHEEQKTGLGRLIEKFKGTLNPEKPEEESEKNKRAA